MNKPIRMVTIFLLLTVMLLPYTALAQERARVFLDAVKDYEQGHYQAAADGFLSIAQEGIVNGKLYYNIANACFKAGDIGRAVLWYEKAFRLMPNDPDLRFNLEYARTRVKDKAPDLVSLPQMLFFWRYWLGRKTVIFLAAAFGLIFCLVMFVKKHLSLNVPAFVRYGALLFFLLFALTASGNFYFDQNSRQGVVLSESISAKSGLSDPSTELFVLHAGSRVTIEQQRNDFYRIRFGKDKVGWVSKDTIGTI